MARRRRNGAPTAAALGCNSGSPRPTPTGRRDNLISFRALRISKSTPVCSQTQQVYRLDVRCFGVRLLLARAHYLIRMNSCPQPAQLYSFSHDDRDDVYFAALLIENEYKYSGSSDSDFYRRPGARGVSAAFGMRFYRNFQSEWQKYVIENSRVRMKRRNMMLVDLLCCRSTEASALPCDASKTHHLRRICAGNGGEQS